MTHDDERDRDLDAWLRQPVERLAPPSGSWERVSQRARRRKVAKALAGTVAGVVVAAGAVPAVIAVRHNSNNAKLETGVAASHLPSPATTHLAPTSTLTGFFPLSVSFVSATNGYAWGTVPDSARGVVAKTTDQGAHWTQVSRPPVAAALNSGTGDGQIRMVSGTVGYLFGPKLFVTKDAGTSWTQLASPGYVDDLEAINQRTWALVRPGGQTSDSVQLYQSSATHPTLRKVDGVSGHAVSGTDSIAVNLYSRTRKDQELYSTDVLFGASTIWQARNGGRWSQLPDPCPSGIADRAGLRAALIASSGTSPKTMAVACGFGETGDLQSKTVLTTSDNGRHWARTAVNPSSTGYLETLTLGPAGTIILGGSGGGSQLNVLSSQRGYHDAWTPATANGVNLGFVGFIGPSTVIALQDPAGDSPGTFAVSGDSGSSWTSYRF